MLTVQTQFGILAAQTFQLWTLTSVEHSASILGIIGCSGQAHPPTQQLLPKPISAAPAHEVSYSDSA